MIQKYKRKHKPQAAISRRSKRRRRRRNAAAVASYTDLLHPVIHLCQLYRLLITNREMVVGLNKKKAFSSKPGPIEQSSRRLVDAVASRLPRLRSAPGTKIGLEKESGKIGPFLLFLANACACDGDAHVT